MNNNEKSDIDLDVIRLCKHLNIGENTDECVFYLRGKNKRMFMSYYGEEVELINIFITAMEQQEGLYEVLSSAVNLYEEDFIVEDS